MYQRLHPSALKAPFYFNLAMKLHHSDLKSEILLIHFKKLQSKVFINWSWFKEPNFGCDESRMELKTTKEDAEVTQSVAAAK